ncbi:MAG: hypothetical protein ACE5EA_11510 [Nitrospirota bacterium]
MRQRKRKIRRLSKSNPSYLSKLNNKMRRFFICEIDKEYIKEQKKLRMGDCLLCGKCCQLVFRCPFLKDSDGYPICHIYHKKRPKPCSAFPIDERDLADVNYRCGYFFPS